MKIPGRSPFQCKTVQAIAEKQEFAHFVTLDGKTVEQTFSTCRRPGPMNVLWYDKDGKLHLTRVGATRILKEIVT